MCTVTWHQDADGLTLYCNRDERRERARAEPPTVRHDGPVATLAPRDPDGGGSWVLANEHGLALSLLNDYTVDPPTPAEGWVSRGLLVADLGTCSTLRAAETRLREATDLETYRPFRLLLLQPGSGPRLVHWNGHEARWTWPEPPLTSSGHDASAAHRRRRRLLADVIEAHSGDLQAALPVFHRSHFPRRGPLSPCMHRPEASTVSLTTIEAGAGEVAIRYADGPPCTTRLGPRLALPLVAAPPTSPTEPTEPTEPE